MNNELSEKLLKAQQGVSRLEKIESMLTDLSCTKAELESKTVKLKESLDKENSDVYNLEKKSISALFYSVFGQLDKHIDKERAEAIETMLKYDNTVKELDTVNSKIEVLSTEKAQYVNCRKDYEILLNQKKAELIQENGETAQKLLELTNSINKSKINIKETEEAISAGEKVRSSMNDILDYLDSAKSWGTWDLLGGGLISDLEKHSKIDDARNVMEGTREQIRDFKSELVDIKIDADFSINISSFDEFADFFLDGLFADFNVLSKINESKDNVEASITQVTELLNKLNELIQKENENITKYEAEIDNVIVAS